MVIELATKPCRLVTRSIDVKSNLHKHTSSYRTHVSKMFQHFAVLGPCRGEVPLKDAAFAMMPRRDEFLSNGASGAHLTSRKYNKSTLLYVTPPVRAYSREE